MESLCVARLLAINSAVHSWPRELPNNTGKNDIMKKALFNELQKSIEQALAYSQGKITLRTKRVPVPQKPSLSEG